MTWQPIDTAPKDGTEIDIWAVSYRLESAITGEVRKITKRFNDCYWSADRQLWAIGSISDDFDGDTFGYIEFTPTHWMLSPKPPGDA